MGTSGSSTASQGARTEADCSPTTHGQEVAATPPNASLAAANPPHHATILVKVNNVYVNALLDSGSTSSFLHPDIMEELAITTYPSQDNIIMAFSLVSKTLGHCFVDLKIQDNSYSKFKVYLLSNLCAKVILGEDFMQLHKSVKFDLKSINDHL